MNFIPLIILALMLSVSPCEASSPKRDTLVLAKDKNAPKASVRALNGKQKKCSVMVEKKYDRTLKKTVKKEYLVCPK